MHSTLDSRISPRRRPPLQFIAGEYIVFNRILIKKFFNQSTMLSQLFKFLLVAARTPQSTTDNLRHGRALPYDTFYLRYPSYRSITNYGCPARIRMYSLLADRTVHPYASVCTSVRLHCSFQSAETKKKKKRRKKRGGGKGKDKNRDSIVKERRSYVDLILLYLRGITGVRSRYL